MDPVFDGTPNITIIDVQMVPPAGPSIFVVGNYTLVYTVRDTSGNAASVNRTVVIRDTLPPNITLLGTPLIVVEANATYSDPGCTRIIPVL